MLGDALFELNWDTNAPSTLRELDLVEKKVDSVGDHADRSMSKFKTAFGGNLFAGVGEKIGNLTGSLKGATSQALATAGSMTPLGGAVTGAGAALGGLAAGAGLAAAALVAGAFAAGRMGDEIQDMADSIGVSTDGLQVWQGAIALAGGAAESFDKAMNKLNVNTGNALSGDKSAIAKFDALGVSLKDAEGKAKSNEVIMGEVRDRLSEVENETQRVAMANDLLGKGAKDMIGVLSMSKEEFDALQKNVSKYGVASAAALQQVGKLGDGMDYLGGAVRAGIINSFAPLTNALGTLAMKAVPLVGEAFKVLGGIIDLVAGVGSLLGDGLKALWDLLVAGAKFIGDLFPVFGKLGSWLNVTGESSLSLRERWAITMGDMIKFAGVMVGRIAGYFAQLAAQTHNVIAGIKNALVDSGIGKLIGVNGKLEIKDSRAAGAQARAGVEDGFAAAGAAFTQRYRGAGNARAASDRPTNDGDARPTATSGSGGSSAKETEAEKATKKYQEAVDKLNQSKRELNLTDEQRRVLDEMEKAGLERNIELVGERADTIRRLVAELQDMEEQKRVTEAVTEYQKALLATTLSEEELVRVEARRRAGLSEDLTITSERIKQVEEAAVAADKAEKKAAAQKEAEAELAEMKRETIELEYELAQQRATGLETYDLELEKIESERVAREAAIREKYKDLEIINQLIAANNMRAEAESNVVKQDKRNKEADTALSNVEKMAGVMESMWGDWRATMKSVLGDFIKELLMAIAKATILKSIMKDTQMGGGGAGGGGIGGILASAVMGMFGGGRASGGPMSAGSGYLVTPGEKFVPATDGYMLSANDLRNIKGGGGKTINMGGLTFHMPSGGDASQSLAQAQEIENTFRNIVRDELARA